MRRIGTFLIAATLFTGAVAGGGFAGTANANVVYASETDAQEYASEEPEIEVVKTEEKSSKTNYYAIPKLVITGRDISGNQVKAGDEFEMVLHLKNESNSTKLRNISLKISSEENQITTASGSDTVYINEIDKEDGCDVTVKMVAKKDLAQTNYPLTVSYKYEDNNKNTFEDSASVVVPVVQEARLGISEKKLSKSEVLIDGKTSLSFKVNNMGLDTLRNVSVEIKGDTIKEINYYVGTVEAGASGSVDMTVTPDQIGEDDIHIKVTFEDAVGNQSFIEDSVELTVTQAAEEADKEVKESSISPVFIGGIVVMIIVVAIVGGVIKRKKQKKYE